MARNTVRTHTRRNPGGGSTTVRRHARSGRPRRGVLTFGHSWQLAKKAFRAARQRKKGMAALLGGAAVLEFTTVGAVRLGSVILGTAGVVAITVALGGFMLAGWRP